MRKSLFVFGIILLAKFSNAQWITSGTNISNNNTGNVGIGTNTPQFKLDLVGTMRTDVTNSPAFTTKSTLGVVIQQANNNNDFFSAESYSSIFAHNMEYNGTNWIRRNQYGNSWATALSYHNYDILFAQQNGTQSANTAIMPTTLLRITKDGNVGIGTTSTGSFKLAVEGKIGAREVHVTVQNPWPDYVFKSTYKRISLDALEAFINTNNHLPNIPSAEEVKKKELI